MYDVAVDLDDLAASECACSANRACTHMAATLMRYAELCGRPIPALVNARSALKSAAASGKPDGGRGSARAGTESAAAEVPSRAGSGVEAANRRAGSLSARLADLDGGGADRAPRCQVARTVPGLPWTGAPARPHRAGGRELLAGLQVMRPKLPWALEQLFTLHALLFVLERMVKPAQVDWRHSGLFMGYHTQLALDELRGQARSLLEDKLALADDSSAYWDRLMETADFLRERMLTEDKTLGCFTALYTSLWLRSFGPDSAGSTALYEFPSR